jgi:GT2 family glycosyltransferase
MLPYISVIIPNWNGVHHLPTCLAALRHQTLRDFEVIVVDNGSMDGSVVWLAQNYPEVRVIALPHNFGFARACNIGISAAKGEILILLNNDTEAKIDWLAELMQVFEAYPEAGMAATKLRLFDRRNVLHSAGDIYHYDGTPANRGVWLEDQGQFDESIWVFSPCGGAAAYRRSMLSEIGLLDEDFGSYLEDVDLGWRAQLAGYRCVFAPRAIVCHRLSATGGGKIASFYTGRNTLWVIAKNYPSSLLRRHWRAIATAQFRVSAAALRAWRGEAARARLRGQLVGLLTWPRLLLSRRQIQQARRVSDTYLESLLEDHGR